MPNGLDFTNDEEELLREQQEWAAEADSWKNLDEKTIQSELNGLNTRLTAFYYQLERMIGDNDYKKAEEMMNALLAKDLGAGGWIASFRETNRNMFSKFMVGTGKPFGYEAFSSEQKQKYEMVMRYYKDTAWLANVLDDMSELLRMVPFRDTFRVVALKNNFEEAGFDEELYRKIDADAASVSAQISQDWNSLEIKADRAEEYYQANVGRLTGSALANGYQQERIKDYQDDVRQCSIYSSLNERSDGIYTVKPDMLAKAAVIDKYSYQVAHLTNLEVPLQRVIETEKKARAYLKEQEKEIRQEATKNLTGALESVYEAVEHFAEAGLDTYLFFKTESGKAPYCFMHQLPCMSSLRNAYGFNPNRLDPWETGTFLENLYREAARALSRHCHDYAYNHGRVLR